VAALSAVTAVLGLVGLSYFNTFWDAPVGSIAEAADDMNAVDEAIAGLAGLAGLVGLVVFILIIIWANQAHKATQDLWHGPRKWSSGWTVGGWFIPLANAVIPKLVLNEIERIAVAPRESGTVASTWTQRPTLPVGWVWWLFFIAGGLTSAIGGSLFDASDGTAGSWRAGYIMVAIGYAALALSSAAGALYIRKISRALRRSDVRDE